MADEDNFDIDVYGDSEEKADAPGEASAAGHLELHTSGHGNESSRVESIKAPQTEPAKEAVASEGRRESKADVDAGANNSLSASDTVVPVQAPAEPSKQLPKKQGIKRKEAPDDRPVDNGATTAVFVSDLNWWDTDDYIRSFAKQTGCEEELKDITFNEHKVNGKSKGQAFVEFTSPQAATALKRKLETTSEGQSHGKRHIVTFTGATSNPYRTLPKDTPVRAKDGQRPQDPRVPPAGGHTNSTWMASGPSHGGVTNVGMGYRGGGRGYAPRGRATNIGGFQNRGFSGGPMVAAGAPPPQTAFAAPQPMGGFAGPMMTGMAPFVNFPNRGNMMGGMRGGPVAPRGGRGGIAPNPMMATMPMASAGGMMGGMPPMGAMAGNVGMGPIGPQAGPGFQAPQAHFNPAFFNQNQNSGGEGQWNPHGAKRQRPE